MVMVVVVDLPQDDCPIFSTSSGMLPCPRAESSIEGTSSCLARWGRVGREPCVDNDTVSQGQLAVLSGCYFTGLLPTLIQHQDDTLAPRRIYYG